MAEPNKVEVVISGIAGVFPESDNVEELKTLLFNKENGVTLDSRRWPLGQFGVTSGVGKVKSINRFDNVFFNMHGKLCDCTETVIKLNLERSVEAVIDAGINPGDLYDTNTAVFACTTLGETDMMAIFNDTKSMGFAIMGHNKAMHANRLSYALNLNGPSFTIYSSFTGGVDAVVMAKHMIEQGHIKTALISGCNLVELANLSLQFKGLGILTDGIETRSFSDNADGFNRSESCVAILLQNSLDAYRSYGTILGVKMEQFGDIRGVFTNYSTEHYKKIIMEAYEEAGIDPANVAYIEADGCAIKEVDKMELDIIKEVFCPPSRKEPLKIGSIKSNIGHTNASAGLVSIVKAIIAMDTGFIPPNINYYEPNSESSALTSGKIKVVTEKTPLDGDIVGLNIFGRTGNYGHIVFKRQNKPKKKIYAKDEMFDDGLPRLILVSGRNDEGVRKTIKLIESYNIDEEYASLLHKVFSKSISAHFSRSSFIVPTPGPWREKDVFPITNEKPPVWFVISGMGSQWLGMGTQLLRIPIFARAIQKCDAVLKPKGIDIIDVITSLDPKLFDNIINAFVGITAIQIGLVDILRALDIEPDGIIGHSLGELCCAYVDGCITAEETILASHIRGRACVESELLDGMMAAIGLSYESVKDILPHDIDVACHNSAESCTLSGPTKSMLEFVDKIKSDGVFAKAVSAANIAFHSRYIKPAAPAILKYLNEAIKSKPKQRSSRWLSTSVPESKWNSDLARYCSPMYFTNNLLSPVYFEEVCKYIPKNAIVIEIAPHGLLQAILKKSLSDMVNISLTQRIFGDSVRYLLNAVGKLYCNGLNPNIETLYNPVTYPVSSGTPPLHTLCSWNHQEYWSITDTTALVSKNKGERYISLSNSSIEDYEVLGHQVLPLSALLYYIWESFMYLLNETNVNLPVIFQDIYYHQHVEINQTKYTNLNTAIQTGTGRFELCFNDNIVLTGYIFLFDSLKHKKNSTSSKENYEDGPTVSLNQDEVYSSLKQFGYCLGDGYKMTKRLDIFQDKLQSIVTWNNHWTHYLDAMLQLPMIYQMEKRGEPVTPVSIQKIQLDPTVIKDNTLKDFTAEYNLFTNEVICDGVVISFDRFEVLPLSPVVKKTFQLSEQGVVHLERPGISKPIDFVDMCMDIILEYNHHDNFEDAFLCPVYSNQDDMMKTFVEHILKTKDFDMKLIDVVMDLNSINSGLKNSKYISLTRYEKLSHTMSLLTNKDCVYLIVFSNSLISESSDYTVILQQQFDGTYLSLMKKNLKDSHDVFIHRLTTENINCTSQFHKLLTSLKSLRQTIYIVSQFQPSEGILSLVKKMSEIKNIRFFFMLDNSAPSFDIKNQFYSKQLAKDLLVNVYTNGEWVTLKEIKLINIMNTQKSTKKTLLVNLSNTSLKDVSVKYIGLNPQDMSIETKNKNVEFNELGPIEYSGLTSDGRKVVGVAPPSSTINDIAVDPILSWSVPDHMSLEEALTIPVPYSMAYYILTQLSNVTVEDYVLVHSGLTALGRAAIHVCLEKNCHVFVTVTDLKQMELLRKTFPSLPHSSIIVYEKENFEIKVLMGKKKMNVIISCLDGEDFHKTIRILEHGGKFFQLTKNDMKKNYKMGLMSFLWSGALYSISMERIIDESEETKKSIQNIIDQGLRSGRIKPFDRYLLTGGCTGVQALEMLENLSRKNDYKRVIIPTEKYDYIGNIANQFQCYPDKLYFVIGNESDDWLCLLEWLVQRGAQKIIVALEKYSLNPKISRKFNIFMDRFKGITVQLVSQSQMNTKELACSLVIGSITTYPLDAIFFMSTVDEKLIENVEYATNQAAAKYNRKPLFACLFCGGAKSCENLKASGFNALCLSWGQKNACPEIAKIIPILDNLLLKSESLKSAVVVCSEHVPKQLTKSKEQLQFENENVFLPNTVEELESNSKYIVDQPDFVEVSTKSVLFADAKGTYPIFVTPGFRPSNIQTLYKNLGYPTFEARYPAKFESIKTIAEVLVKKLRKITEHHAVTLVGESWGGSVALLMTQILETEGILVSLSLLNGVPNTLIEWTTETLILNNNINAKLLSKYLSIDEEIAEKYSSQREWNSNLIELLESKNVSSVRNVCDALNMIHTQLNTLIALEPLPNKLLTIPQVFISKETPENIKNPISEFCSNLPVIHIIAEADNQSMLNDSMVIKTINENVAFDYLHTSEKSLDDKYSQHYYSSEIRLTC